MLDYLVILALWVVLQTVAAAMGLPAWAAFGVCALVALPSLWGAIRTAPYVPTDSRTAAQMVDIAEVSPGDRVIDLGCGDGRIVEAARQRGALAEGVELSVPLWVWCRLRGIQGVRYGSMWSRDLSEYDVVFAFLSPRGMKRFAESRWPGLKPGCRVIAHAFPLPGKEPSRSDGVVYRYDRDGEPGSPGRLSPNAS